jgi:lipid-A-disaccharide synthase
LIQDQCSKKNLQKELKTILDPNYRQNLLQKYEVLEEKLGGIGASAKTAQLIVGDLK